MERRRLLALASALVLAAGCRTAPTEPITAAPAVVFIHGWGLDGGVWADQMKTLASRHMSWRSISPATAARQAERVEDRDRVRPPPGDEPALRAAVRGADPSGRRAFPDAGDAGRVRPSAPAGD